MISQPLPLTRISFPDGAWLTTDQARQEERFAERLADPLKRWKISDMDLKGRDLWQEYSQAKDDMLRRTDTAESPWWVIESDDKKRTRLNCINHLLTLIDYKDVLPPSKKLPKRKEGTSNRHRAPFSSQRLIPTRF